MARPRDPGGRPRAAALADPSHEALDVARGVEERNFAWLKPSSPFTAVIARQADRASGDASVSSSDPAGARTVAGGGGRHACCSGRGLADRAGSCFLAGAQFATALRLRPVELNQ